MMSPGTLVNAIRSALAFVILLECFAAFLSLATPDEMPRADKAAIKIAERRKSLGFMIQVRLNCDGSPCECVRHLLWRYTIETFGDLEPLPSTDFSCHVKCVTFRIASRPHYRRKHSAFE